MNSSLPKFTKLDSTFVIISWSLTTIGLLIPSRGFAQISKTAVKQLVSTLEVVADSPGTTRQSGVEETVFDSG